jgi:hypothetical protein
MKTKYINNIGLLTIKFFLYKTVKFLKGNNLMAEKVILKEKLVSLNMGIPATRRA